MRKLKTKHPGETSNRLCSNTKTTKMTRLGSTIFMMLFTTASFGQGSNESDKTQIENLVIGSFDEIWSKLNSNNIDTYYTEDFLLLENGVVWNNDSISNYLDNAILRKPNPERVNTIEIIEIKIENRMAWIAYHNRATFSIDHKIIRSAHWLESAAAVLTENGWKLEMLHATRVENE